MVLTESRRMNDNIHTDAMMKDIKIIKQPKAGISLLTLPFPYLSLPFFYLSLPFPYLSLPFPYLSLPFPYLSLPFLHLPLSFPYLSLSFPYLSLLSLHLFLSLPFLFMSFPFLSMSFPRKRESSFLAKYFWTPAFAGITRRIDLLVTSIVSAKGQPGKRMNNNYI